jgi:hypothetical protein
MNDKIPSILNQIKHSLNSEGKLDYTFELIKKEQRKPNELSFVAGAKENILGISDKPAEKTSCVMECLMANNKEISTLVKHLNEESIDVLYEANNTLHNDIYENRSTLDGDHGYAFASECILTSSNPEVVKAGLIVLGSLENFGDKLIEPLKLIALYESFTNYVIYIFKKFPDGNDWIFDIAKKTHGWGKINAVENLEVTNDEMKYWLASEGCSNAVMDGYLSYECAQKINIYEYVKKEQLSQEELAGLKIIISALINEDGAPCAGISDMEHPVELLSNFYNQIKNNIADCTQIKFLTDVEEYLVENHEENEIANTIVNSIKTQIEQLPLEKIVINSLNKNDNYHIWIAVYIANKMNINIADELFRLLKSDYLKYSSYTWYFFKHKILIDEILDLYEKSIDLSLIATGMGDSLGFGDNHSLYMSLTSIIQELGDSPNKGVNLIKTALQSPVVSHRNMAARAMKSWSVSTGFPLKEFNSELYLLTKQTISIEVNDTAKENLTKLI